MICKLNDDCRVQYILLCTIFNDKKTIILKINVYLEYLCFIQRIYYNKLDRLYFDINFFILNLRVLVFYTPLFTLKFILVL